MAVTSSAVSDPSRYLQAQTRWHRIEFAFWAATLLPFVLFPNHLVLASQIAITALFALSLDLILGYAGIVSLGHAAFFGLGAYTAGIIYQVRMERAARGIGDRPGGRRPRRICDELHHRPLPPPPLDHDHHGPGVPPARGGQQRGVADGRLRRAAGDKDRPDLRPVPVRSLRLHGLRLLAGRSVRRVSGDATADQLAVRPVPARHPREPACACPPSARRAARISARSTRFPP